jgi:hypothetical protein
VKSRLLLVDAEAQNYLANSRWGLGQGNFLWPKVSTKRHKLESATLKLGNARVMEGPMISWPAM